jgi:hypothetical protein
VFVVILVYYLHFYNFIWIRYDFSKVRQFSGIWNKQRITFHTYPTASHYHWLVDQCLGQMPPRQRPSQNRWLVQEMTSPSQELTDEFQIRRFVANWVMRACGIDSGDQSEATGTSAACFWSSEPCRRRVRAARMQVTGAGVLLDARKMLENTRMIRSSP